MIPDDPQSNSTSICTLNVSNWYEIVSIMIQTLSYWNIIFVKFPTSIFSKNDTRRSAIKFHVDPYHDCLKLKWNRISYDQIRLMLRYDINSIKWINLIFPSFVLFLFIFFVFLCKFSSFFLYFLRDQGPVTRDKGQRTRHKGQEGPVIRDKGQGRYKGQGTTDKVQGTRDKGQGTTDKG